MKKCIIIALCFFGLGVFAQTPSNIQTKDLVVIYQNDTTGINSDTAGLPAFYQLIVKIDSISNAKKIYFKFGTANDLDNVFSLVGTVHESVDPGGLGNTYTIEYNGQSFPFQSFTAALLIPYQSLGTGVPLIVTFYVEDKLDRFTEKIYYTIKE